MWLFRAMMWCVQESPWKGEMAGTEEQTLSSRYKWKKQVKKIQEVLSACLEI